MLSDFPHLHVLDHQALHVRYSSRSLSLSSLIHSFSPPHSLSHPFLLSDNRHYTFYVYRRILNVHPIARYALSPFYLLSIRLLWDRLSSSSTLTLLPSLFYILSLSLTLIPSPLIEPRYFIVPWVILRLHLRIEGATSRERRTRLALEAASYLAVNAVTVGVFVCKPFEWEGRVDKMRFMW